MSAKDLQLIWQQAQSNPYLHTALSLMLLNGLNTGQIRQLADAQIDLHAGWITTHDAKTYPLVTQTRDALGILLESESELSVSRLETACQQLDPFEGAAHRQLSGAIWINDDELQIMLKTTGPMETPILPLRFTFPFSIVDRLQPDETSDVAQRAHSVLQTSANWLVVQILATDMSPLQRLLHLLRQGSLVFLIVSTGVSGLNLIHNVLMGRLLSPADYSQLTFIITLQLLIGLLPMAIQTVVARFAARYHAQDDSTLLATLYARLGRLGWQAGFLIAFLLLLLSPIMVSMFQLDSIALLLPIIIAVPFFVRMGPDRGMLQGMGRSFWLSGAYLAEGSIRLTVSVMLGYALVSAGRSLEGAIWGVAQAMLITWFISWLALRHLRTDKKALPDDPIPQAEWLQVGWMAGLVLIGQALITDSDFLLVKNFFSSDDAGLYAAITVLGRIVYFGALPLTILLIPLVARKQALNEPTRPILLLLIGGGVVVCGGLVLGSQLFATDILRLLYGDAYVPAASLLAPYALAASLYTLTNLVITYQVALGCGKETWMPIAAGSAQVVAIIVFHESLTQVIAIQIILMGLLFGVVLWRVMRSNNARSEPEAVVTATPG